MQISQEMVSNAHVFQLTVSLKPVVKISTFREDSTSTLAGVRAGPLCWSNWNLERPAQNVSLSNTDAEHNILLPCVSIVEVDNVGFFY